MKVRCVEKFEQRSFSDCLIIAFFEEKLSFKEKKNFSEKWNVPLKEKDFLGKVGETCFFYSEEEKNKRILFLGLGKEEDITHDSIRKSFSKALIFCKDKGLKKISLIFPDKCMLKDLFKTVLESLFLSNYWFHRLKKDSLKEEKKSLIQSIEIIGIKEDKKLIDKIEKITDAVNMARDLVNNNADDTSPKRLEEVSLELEKISKKIKVTVFDKEKIAEEKMDLLLAVNRGSSFAPSFIIIDYTSNQDKDRTVFIGKGITYDTGGLSLKPSNAMETMKCDMAGAASVISTLYLTALLDLNVNVTGIIPATENSIGPKSYKPGDVYNSYSKKSVEVENTDAEGRLVLADAIAYAVDKIKPSRIIDIATLTGAVSIALGEEIAAVFSNDEKMWEILKKASENTGEKVWRLPLYKEYMEKLKSKIADIKNVGGRTGGVITAALFLEAFVKNTCWMHIDIGNVAYLKKRKGIMPDMGTGFGVRLFLEFLENLK